MDDLAVPQGTPISGNLHMSMYTSLQLANWTGKGVLVGLDVSTQNWRLTVDDSRRNAQAYDMSQWWKKLWRDRHTAIKHDLRRPDFRKNLHSPGLRPWFSSPDLPGLPHPILALVTTAWVFHHGWMGWIVTLGPCHGVGCYIFWRLDYPFFVGWCEPLGHRNQPLFETKFKIENSLKLSKKKKDGMLNMFETKGWLDVPCSWPCGHDQHPASSPRSRSRDVKIITNPRGPDMGWISGSVIGNWSMGNNFIYNCYNW